MAKSFVECEGLESRRLMSGGNLQIATVWQVFGGELTSKGTLVVKGDAGANHISIIRDGNWIKMSRPSSGAEGGISTFNFSASKVKRVLVEAGGGDDRVFIDNELNKPTTVVGGSGNDVIEGNMSATLIGGAGNDKLSVPPPGVWVASANYGQDDVIVTGTSLGPALLSGGDGNDTLAAAASDSVVGGRGEDLAVERIILASRPVDLVDARADFGPRASGIEEFDEVIVLIAGVKGNFP